MPRITPVGYQTLLKIFQMFGYQYKRKEGSHHILTFPGVKRAVVIPEYDEIEVEIIKNNMRTVGMTREQYAVILTLKLISQKQHLPPRDLRFTALNRHALCTM